MVEFYVNKNEIKISDRSVAILVVGGVVMSIIGRLNLIFQQSKSIMRAVF